MKTSEGRRAMDCSKTRHESTGGWLLSLLIHSFAMGTAHQEKREERREEQAADDDANGVTRNRFSDSTALDAFRSKVTSW
jgi:hypothetical protein